MLEPDETDLKILKLLQANSELTTREIADRINLTTTPVYERIRRMERDGYIKKYVALLDRAKLKKGLLVFCNIRLKEHSREIGEKFVKDILTLPEVVECYNTSGEYDFMLKIMIEDMPAYQSFIMNNLASIENIGYTHSVFVMGEIKSTTGIPI